MLHGIRGWNPVPVVVLSARATSDEKVAALDAGADDYVTKPFEMNELLARVRAAVRRGAMAGGDAAPHVVNAGSFEVDLAAGIVTRDGGQVRLTPTEYHLLEVLARHLGRLVPQQQLLTEVWGPGYEKETPLPARLHGPAAAQARARSRAPRPPHHRARARLPTRRVTRRRRRAYPAHANCRRLGSCVHRMTWRPTWVPWACGPGDLVFLHASLRRIGPVEGGALGVIEASSGPIGADGTLVMILGAANEWDWVNSHPESERAALLADAEPFDNATTPVLPEVGVLAEVLRTMPGTVVNDHPEGRFAARGRLAHELLDDLPWDDYYGPGSALDRFVAAGGRVLRLGANPDTVSVLHFAEYCADVPDTVRIRRHRKVLGPDGPRIVVVECMDDENGIVPDERQPAEDYFAIILREFLATGRALVGHGRRRGRRALRRGGHRRLRAAWMTANLR